MADKLLPQAPIETDVTEYHPNAETKKSARGIIGGFPCQVFWLYQMEQVPNDW